MRYSYSSGFDTFTLAQKTHWRSSLVKRVQWHAAVGSVVAICLVDLLTAYFLHLPGMPWVLIGCGLIGAGLGNLLSRQWNRKRVYRAVNGDPDRPLSVDLEIDGPVLVSGNQGRREGRFQRAAICSVVEDDEMILLYFAKKRFLFLRKSLLPEQGMSELRRWLARPEGSEIC